MTLHVLRADRDRHEWLSAWALTAAREPFAHPDYAALFAARGVTPLCAVGRDGDTVAMFPFLLRELSEEPWTGAAEVRRDIAVPAGYGGAYVRGQATSADGAEFWREFRQWAVEQEVVCADARISLYRDEILPMAGWAEKAACDSVVVDLEIFRREDIGSFGRSLRRNVRAARAKGVVAEPDDTPAAFMAFRDLYLATMDRVGAVSSYYFSPEFFAGLAAALGKGLARLFIGRAPDGTPVCGTVVLLGRRRGYDFLTGSDETSRGLGAHELVRTAICSWLADNGLTELVLGGGNKPDDQLFEHKLRFAPYGRRPYHVGSWIYDRAAYDDLIRTRQDHQRASGLPPHVARRFPDYR